MYRNTLPKLMHWQHEAHVRSRFFYHTERPFIRSEAVIYDKLGERIAAAGAQSLDCGEDAEDARASCGLRQLVSTELAGAFSEPFAPS